MTDYQTFWQAVFQNPTDRTTALVFADWLQDNMGRTRIQALRRVGKVRRDERNSREMTAAAALMQVDHDGRSDIAIAVLWGAGESIPMNVGIFLVPGSRPPKASAAMQREGNQWVRVVTILVGARWVIRENERIVSDHQYFHKALARRDAAAAAQ